VSQATVTALATSLHDGLAAGRDVTTDVADLFRWMGVPVLGDADGALAAAHLANGTFFALDVQAGVIARSLATGATFDVSAVVSALSPAFGAMPSGPLTVSYLSGLLAAPSTAPTLAPADQPLALLTALGRERARRSAAGITDPLWGDGRLDLLQFALLDYLTSSPPAAAAHVTAAGIPLSPVPRLVKANLKIADGLRRLISGDRTPAQGICEQLFRGGLRLTTVVTPGAIAKPDAPPPNQAQATAVAEFDVPTGVQPAAALLAGCSLPASGRMTSPVLVAWSMEGTLAAHVSFQNASEVTQGGVAAATIAAATDPTAAVVRGAQLTAAGRISAHGIATSARYPNLPVQVTSQPQGSLLSVRYYEPVPFLTASFFVDVRATGIWEPATQLHPADELRTQWQATNVRLDRDAQSGLYRAVLTYVGSRTATGPQWSVQRTYTSTCARLLGETSPQPGFQVFALPGTAGDFVMTFALTQPAEQWEDRPIGIAGDGTLTCGTGSVTNWPGSMLMTGWAGNHILSGPPPVSGVGVTGLVSTADPRTFLKSFEWDLPVRTGTTTHESSDFQIVVPP
jgi:hypothetical protein